MAGKIAVLNAGAQYQQLIPRVLKEKGAEVDVLPIDTPLEQLTDYKGIVISGGPKSVNEPGAPMCDKDIFSLGVPILGICYGMQLGNKLLGGKVGPLSVKEYGEIKIEVEEKTTLFEGIEDKIQRVLMSHGDSLIELAPGMRRVAYSTNLLTGEKVPAAVYCPEAQFYGVQFHPEVEITEEGERMLSNFIDICGARRSDIQVGETYRDYRAELGQVIEAVREKVGQKRVITGMSGGCDSTIARAILKKALRPDQIISAHFKTWFERKHENEQVVEALNTLGYGVSLIDAGDTVFNVRGKAREDVMNGGTLIRKGEYGPPLIECIHPELKRWAFSEGYKQLFLRVMRQEGLTEDNCFFVQGTLFTDRVESGETSGETVVIKSHHNVGLGIPEIRPNENWHKDEVRIVGKILGVPEEFILRPPFPGPGLGCRIVCNDGVDRRTEDDMKLFSELEQMANKIAGKFGMKVFLTPNRTVGVAGDDRDYSYLAIMIPKKPWEKMDAKDWQEAKDAANAIPMYAYATSNGKQEGISRVLLSYRRDIQGYGNITPTFLTPETIDLIREPDYIVRMATARMGLDRIISQFPVSLLPLDFGFRGGRAVDLRPFKTKDWMTGRPVLPGEGLPLEFLVQVVPELQSVPGVCNVLFDLSSKPKGTTELE